MPRTLHTHSEYPPDWPEINARVCAAVGHRCIRCGHPYAKGTHGNGEWSPCDEKCTHEGPIAHFGGGHIVPYETKETAGAVVRAGILTAVAQWRILTVHHFDGNKANCVWWNLLALCQRCHLRFQGRVNPEQPYMFEHSAWLKPYVAGFYAKKYEGRDIERSEAEARLDELLKHELLTP